MANSPNSILFRRFYAGSGVCSVRAPSSFAPLSVARATHSHAPFAGHTRARKTLCATNTRPSPCHPSDIRYYSSVVSVTIILLCHFDIWVGYRFESRAISKTLSPQRLFAIYAAVPPRRFVTYLACTGLLIWVPNVGFEQPTRSALLTGSFYPVA